MDARNSSLVPIQTPSGNHYLLDYDNKYFSLVHPLLIDRLQERTSQVAPDYYTRKADFLISHGVGILRAKKATPLLRKNVEDNLSNLWQIVFEVTDSCNLECRYCRYGELYGGYDTRSRKMMTLNRILPVFEYMRQRWDGPDLSYKRSVMLSFYGGEPLINIAFIKDVVAYIRKTPFKNITPLFSMTTNAILLDKYMDFLVENDFQILVSLDGNRENHSYRITHDGKNSFDMVVNNLDKLRERYPVYFNEKIQFNAVLHNKNSVEDIHNFIVNKYEKIPRISEVSSNGILNEKRDEFNMLYRNSQESLCQSENYKILEEERLTKTASYEEGLKVLWLHSPFVFKNYTEFIDYDEEEICNFTPTGTCPPCKNKIFITVNGKILPCEHIGHQFHIGKITEMGVVLEASYIADFYNSCFALIKDQCKTCYRQRGCGQCIFNIDNLESRQILCKGYTSKNDYAIRISSTLELFENHPIDYYRMMMCTYVK